MKKIVSIIIAIYICAFGIITVSAATVYVNDYFKYTVENQSVTIVSYYGQDTEVTVPSVIAGKPVNTIAAGAFSGCANVIKITLPDTIMTIEDGAFRTEQSVVHQKNTSDNHDESTDNKVNDTLSENSSTVVDEPQTSGKQENEQKSTAQSGQTDTSSSTGAEQPAIGVDEQEAMLDSEDESKPGSTQSIRENHEEKQQPNYIWLLGACVLCIAIVGSIIYVNVRKKRG